MSRSQLSRIEALENYVEVQQRAPLGTLWLRAADYATDEEEHAIRDVCCEAMRERGYQPMVIVLVSPALDGGATAPRPQWSNPDPYIVMPWGAFGSERAADTLIGAASAAEERALVETPREESTPVVAISFVMPEPELLERSFGGPSSWMR